MSQRYSKRYQTSKRNNRSHVRAPGSGDGLPMWMIGIATVVALVAVAVLVQAVVGYIQGDDVTDDAQSNRLWLPERWTSNATTNTDLVELSTVLEQNSITAVYVETGAWRQDGTYREWDFAITFREELRRVSPDVRAFVWIWYEPSQHATTTSQNAVINYVQTAIEEWGYDGVHIQGYTILNESQNYVDFISAMNDAIPGNRTLSITAPPDHSPSDVNVPRGEGNPDLSWRPGYKERIARLVDEMVLMAHASGLDSRDDYEDWVAYQVETYANDIDRSGSDTDLIIAFPTYPRELFHDPQVENVLTTANGARTGIRNAGNAGSTVVGAGIYIYDTTTDADWANFAGFWLDN